jgi:hypothetical protein
MIDDVTELEPIIARANVLAGAQLLSLSARSEAVQTRAA